MRNKLRNGVWWLAIFVVMGTAVSIVRQNNLNHRMLEAIQLREGASAVRALIQQGADPNAGGNEGSSALFGAVGLGPPETVQVLLEAGASIKPVEPYGTGPIFEVTYDIPDPKKLTVSECRTIIQELQSKGESIEERDALGDTPLIRAVWSGNTIATEALLDLGANPHVVNKCGQTVWDWTGRIPPEQAKLVKLLREHNAGVHRS